MQLHQRRYNAGVEPTQSLTDQLYVDKVLAARQRSFADKFLAAGLLYEAVVERMTAGIRLQKPAASDAEVAHELQRRFTISRLLENAS
jgi:hypothetical protein